MTQEAIQQRMEELTGAAKKMALDEDIEKTQGERLELFFLYIKVMGVLLKQELP